MLDVKIPRTASSGFSFVRPRKLAQAKTRAQCPKRHLLVILVSLTALGSSLPAIAQSNNALSVKVGEADFFPEIRFDYITDSNPSRSSQDEVSATGFILSPEARLVADKRLLSIFVSYAGRYAVFSEDVLDFDDHALNAGLQAELSSRHRVSTTLEVEKSHDELDEGAVLERSTILVEHLTTTFNTQYVFGAAEARGNVVGGLDAAVKSFSNIDNNDFTDTAIYGRFSYRLSADTRGFAELRLRDVNFENDFRDRSELITSLGLAFSQTGKTGGEAKVGFTSAEYDAEGRDDTSLLSAAVDLFFEPSSISRLVLTFERQLNDDDAINAGNTSADAIDDNFGLRWIYNWSGFVTTRASVGAERLSRDCPSRGATRTVAGFEVGLKPRRWLEFGTGIQISQRSDNECLTAGNTLNSLDYERQRVNVFVRATL